MVNRRFVEITMQDAQAGNANGTVVNLSGYTQGTMHVIGTFTGTVNFEGSNDGTNFTNLIVANNAISGVGLANHVISVTAATLVYLVSFPKLIRARTSSMSAGSVSVLFRGELHG
jgi:hypothetical protein